MTNSTDQEISLGFPEATELELKIIMGPGQLRITPAASDDWVTGTYVDPTGNIPLRVEISGNRAKIAQTLSLPGLKWPRGAPVLELTLGARAPYALIIEGGANEIAAELGGLPLDRFECRVGAGQCKIGFGEPNPRPMDRFQFTGGAAELTASGIVNANAAEMAIEAGAAALHLDFSGALTRDVHARINAGAAGIDIAVPGDTAAKIKAQSVLAGVELGDGFQTREGGYWTAAAVAGGTPVLLIDANVTLSGLKIRAT